MARVLSILFVLCYGISTAFAATLSGLQGNVMVNRGQGFQPVTEGAVVNPGDRVMVPNGGSATITYPNGYTTLVASDTQIAVLANPPAPIVPPVGGGLLVPGLIGAGIIGGAVAIASSSGSSDKKPASVSP